MKLSISGVYSFFLLILFFSVFFVLKPPHQQALQEIQKQEVATLEIQEFSFYLVEKRKLEMQVQGEKARQYKDREEFDDFLITRYHSNLKQGLKQPEHFYVTRGIRRDQIYEFYDGVFYHQEQGYSFGGQGGVYDYTQMVFVGNGEFALKDQKGEFYGSNLYYNAKTSLMRADNPRGKVWLEK